MRRCLRRGPPGGPAHLRSPSRSAPVVGSASRYSSTDLRTANASPTSIPGRGRRRCSGSSGRRCTRRSPCPSFWSAVDSTVPLNKAATSCHPGHSNGDRCTPGRGCSPVQEASQPGVTREAAVQPQPPDAEPLLPPPGGALPQPLLPPGVPPPPQRRRAQPRPPAPPPLRGLPRPEPSLAWPGSGAAVP